MGKRVLLADDSATIQKLVKMALAGTSYELQSAFDGREALKLVDAAAPDIVLADAIMPDMDGYELCRAVKDDPRLVGVPVVLLIGRFQPFDEQRAEDAGIDERMIKPFSAENLIRLIERLLAASADKRVPVAEEADSGDLDATVNMSAEELAAHTSHWQQDQTAMTEDIPRIEDIEFDEDVQFDDDSVTSNLGEADTMMLEDALDDSADLDGPMTMELSTEDLADIDEPVTSFDEVTNSIDPEDQLLPDDALDDDLEELDESDLLDDSIAEFEGDFSQPSASQFVPLEDQDTGPLNPVKQALPAAEAEVDDTNDTQPHDVEIAEEANDMLADEDFLSPEEVVEDSEPAAIDFDAAPEFTADTTAENEEQASEIAEAAVPVENPVARISMTTPEEQATDDTDQTVAVSPEWIAANLVQKTEPEQAAEEPPLEVDDELPLEESAVEQDALLDDADYEPLSSAIEEPLADALLAEEAPTVSVDMDHDVLEPSEEVVALADEEEALSDAVADMTEEVNEESSLEETSSDESSQQIPVIAMAPPMNDAVEEVEPLVDEGFRSEMPTQEVPPPDFDDDEDLLEAEVAEVVPLAEVAPAPAVEAELPTAADVEEVQQDAVAVETDEVQEEAGDESADAADFAGLSENQLNKLADMVAERVMRKFERDTLREIAWEVIPELSEAMIKKRIFELEREADNG